jgi:hypothetical protein
MTDMHHGTNWHELETQTVYEIGNHGTVRDIPNKGIDAPTKLYKHRYGLHLTLNGDGYLPIFAISLSCKS